MRVTVVVPAAGAVVPVVVAVAVKVAVLYSVLLLESYTSC
jgi:hypothetical protein